MHIHVQTGEILNIWNIQVPVLRIMKLLTNFHLHAIKTAISALFSRDKCFFYSKKKPYMKSPSSESWSPKIRVQSQNTSLSFTEKTFINILPEENITEDGENCDCH